MIIEFWLYILQVFDAFQCILLIYQCFISVAISDTRSKMKIRNFVKLVCDGLQWRPAAVTWEMISIDNRIRFVHAHFCSNSAAAADLLYDVADGLLAKNCNIIFFYIALCFIVFIFSDAWRQPEEVISIYLSEHCEFVLTNVARKRWWESSRYFFCIVVTFCWGFPSTFFPSAAADFDLFTQVYINLMFSFLFVFAN